MKRLLLLMFLMPALTLSYAQDYSRLTEENHPRLLMNDDTFSRMKSALSDGNHGYLEAINDIIMQAADSLSLTTDPVEYKFDASNKRILHQSRKAMTRIFYCAYAYRMTGEKRYLERAETDIMQVCSFPDWNPPHFLDVAEMAVAVGLGYDWLYRALSEECRQTARKALMEKAFIPSTNEDVNWFYYNEGNWNQVCNAGLSVAALATYEHCDTTAVRIIEDAVRTNRPIMKKIYAPDGNYAEGPDYWSYGTMFQALMLTSFETVLGTDFGLGDTEGFSKTPEYLILTRGATHKQFNYYDNGMQETAAYPLWYFADRLGNPSLVFNELRLLESGHFLDTECTRLLPMLMCYAMRIDLDKATAPDVHYFTGRGITPVMMYRGDWSSSDSDVFVGFKGGTPNSSHAHLDGGSFVYDSHGVRWAMDLDRFEYADMEKPIKELGGDLWDLSAGSFRWMLFRMNNRQHSTITVNGHDHNIKGKGLLVGSEDSDGRHGATMDLSSLFTGDLDKAFRTVTHIEGQGLEIIDDITAPATAPANIRWTMVTSAEPEMADGGIILHSEGKSLMLRASASSGDLVYKFWSTDPEAYLSPTASFEDKNPGTWLVGFEMSVPTGQSIIITTTLGGYSEENK